MISRTHRIKLIAPKKAEYKEQNAVVDAISDNCPARYMPIRHNFGMLFFLEAANENIRNDQASAGEKRI